MTVPTTETDPVAPQCAHCTVPTNGGEVCTFCATYNGAPVDSTVHACCGSVGRHAHMCATEWSDGLLASAYSLTDRAAGDLTELLDALPDDAPLLAVVDIVSAKAHVVAAQRLLDQVARRITNAAVTR